MVIESEVLKKLLEDNGLSIKQDELAKHFIGSHAAALNNHNYIMVSSGFSAESKNYYYAVIHEIAHYQIYKKRSEDQRFYFVDSRIMYNRGYKTKIPVNLWDEAKAWYQTCRILRDNNFALIGFYKFAMDFLPFLDQKEKIITVREYRTIDVNCDKRTLLIRSFRYGEQTCKPNLGIDYRSAYGS